MVRGIQPGAPRRGGRLPPVRSHRVPRAPLSTHHPTQPSLSPAPTLLPPHAAISSHAARCAPPSVPRQPHTCHKRSPTRLLHGANRDRVTRHDLQLPLHCPLASSLYIALAPVLHRTELLQLASHSSSPPWSFETSAGATSALCLPLCAQPPPTHTHHHCFIFTPPGIPSASRCDRTTAGRSAGAQSEQHVGRSRQEEGQEEGPEESKEEGERCRRRRERMPTSTFPSCS